MYKLEIIWTQSHGGSSRWLYEGTPAGLREELLSLASDLETLPDYDTLDKTRYVTN